MTSFFSTRSSDSASWFIPMTGPSSPPTISSVGAFTYEQRGPCQIGPSASRHHCADARGPFRRGHQCCCRAGAGPEVADLQVSRFRLLHQPIRNRHEPAGKQSDVEPEAARAPVHLFLVQSQKVDQEGREAIALQFRRDKTVARAMPAAPAAMREQYDSTRADPGSSDSLPAPRLELLFS